VNLIARKAPDLRRRNCVEAAAWRIKGDYRSGDGENIDGF
jgi:hypothetical protein